jgi:pyrimidine operon attenuation protein/uracil phosphoribosyltransferase
MSSKPTKHPRPKSSSSRSKSLSSKISDNKANSLSRGERGPQPKGEKTVTGSVDGAGIGTDSSVAPRVIPPEWRLIWDESAIDKALNRIAFEILERESDFKRLAIVGIKTYGELLARRLRNKITAIEKKEPKFGVIDITLYRDDIGSSNPFPVLKGSELGFEVSGARIVLVDDVLFTGRTIRGALDAITDYGRPQRVELAALIDRGHRELPIRADYVGKNMPTRYKDKVFVRLSEFGYSDGVYLVSDEAGV